MANLPAVRDLLMPGWRGKVGRNGASGDIVVDKETGSLVVSAWLDKSTVHSFTITSSEIDDGSYKSTFMPNMDKLLAKLRNEHGR